MEVQLINEQEPRGELSSSSVFFAWADLEIRV